MRTATLLATYVLTLMAGFNPDHLPPGITVWRGTQDWTICCPEGDDESPYVFGGTAPTSQGELASYSFGVDYEPDDSRLLQPRKTDPTAVEVQLRHLDVDAKLNLTLEQKAAIRVIIEDVMAKAKKLAQANASKEKLDALGDERHERIEAVLTTEQKKKFDAIAGHK